MDNSFITLKEDPKRKTLTVPYNILINSKQRDLKKFATPSYYRVHLGMVFKNVVSIELKGSIIPRSSYNVHTTNNYIDFSIGSSITNINLTNEGAGYDTPPVITIDKPIDPLGVQATATAILSYGKISSINITNPGSGYSAGSPPGIYISIPNTGRNMATATAKVGVQYTAKLRVGQYAIGGNPATNNLTDTPTGLLKEVQDAMNYAANGAPYIQGSTGPFVVRLVSQYPEIDAVIGTPEYYNTNCAQFNRVQIINTSSSFELLFGTGVNCKNSSSSLLGYSMINYKSVNITGASNLIPSGYAIRAKFDYDLLDDPKFLMLTFTNGSDTFNRVISDNESVAGKYASVIFDANYTDCIKDTTGTNHLDTNNINQLMGPVTKGNFWIPPGPLKPIKGFDYDNKKLNFVPPMGKLDFLDIYFTKYGTKTGGSYEFYDFQGRDHVLLFEINCEH